jgi:hypothetical protein
MLLDVRSTAINIAVLFFFGLGIIGWTAGLSPATCCKRAVMGAIGAYIVSHLAIKAFNAIVISAAVNAETSRKKEHNRRDGN